MVGKYGIILLGLGITLILLYGIVTSLSEVKRIKEKYTPEK